MSTPGESAHITESTCDSKSNPLNWMLALSENLSAFESLSNGVIKGSGAHMVNGLAEGSEPFLLASLHEHTNAPSLVICASPREVRNFCDKLREWLPEEQVAALLPLEVFPHLQAAHSSAVGPQRLRALGILARGDSAVVVTCPAGLQRRLPPRQDLRQAFFTLHRGQAVDRQHLIHELNDLGYHREDAVKDPGQFAARGGIVDIFSPTRPLPVRLEFFGDSVDSLREFKPQTQRSVRNLDEAQIGPAKEVFSAVCDRTITEAVQLLKEDAEDRIDRLRHLGQDEVASRLKERIASQVNLLQGDRYGSLDALYPYLNTRMDTLFDYLSRRAFVAIVRADEVKKVVEQESEDLKARQKRLVQEGVALENQLAMEVPSECLYPGPQERPRVYLSPILKDVDDTQLENVVRISARPSEKFYGQWEVFLSQLEQWRNTGTQVIIVTKTSRRAKRLRASLSERDIPVVQHRGGDSVYGKDIPVVVTQGELTDGFEVSALDVVLLTDEDVFGNVQRVPYRVSKKERRSIVTHEDLNEGDYVVHHTHGIGQYLGLAREEVDGIQRDYMLLRYADGDRLYVPVESIDLVQKYVGAEGEPPKLYRLDSGEWRRVKRRVKKSVEDMAEDLLRLYAARKAAQGYAFPPDDQYQRKFEASFPYQETADQLEAADRIKQEMQKPHPMDYLLCGDVGYGKTEVAFRAAFQAMMSGKQVAFLVPTTVLAHQHFQTAGERFEDWPVEISMLSRFRTRKQQADIVTQLRRGNVDMLVGTHRILSEDVQFKDLGLVIVDEEQRFGVADKERLKQLKETVDVLTLTATPIPRTLHMAVSGLRDMSVIRTPPQDRLPVSTYVMQFDEEVLADAIRRELHRGGQVFYVHNRVRTIKAARNRAQKLAPNADIVVAHGQMPERQLESIMKDFVAGHYDVLVCTTIIESGLDIPNVNTLIVENAEMFGLAQLYQLRGRVGRSDRLAYAYFTYRAGKTLNEMAAKRLHALREFTELGSGLRLAKRDLQLRGAGDVLGAEQHGHIVDVGFDLYSQLLEEAVEQLKEGKKRPPLQKPSFQLQIDAYLSADYIPSSAHRIELYRAVSGIEGPGEAEDLLDEMIDRFGEPPAPAVNLVYLEKLKMLGGYSEVITIERDARTIRLQMLQEHGSSINWSGLDAAQNLRVSTRRRDERVTVTLRPERVGESFPTGTDFLKFLENLLLEIAPEDGLFAKAQN